MTQNYKMSYFLQPGSNWPLSLWWHGLHGSAAVLSSLFLTAADTPRGDVTLHLNVEEDVPIVLPNCNVVVPFKR